MSSLLLNPRQTIERSYAELQWRRYAHDPFSFFQDCLWIPSQRDEKGRERFTLFDYQVEDLHTFLNNRYVVVLKARQIGMSTLVGALALWRCLFRPGSVVLWVSNNQDNANKAVAMLETMWQFLPDWVRERSPKLTGNQAGKKEWTFDDGMNSRLRAYAGTPTAGASETASIVILDEFALIEPHIQGSLLRSAEPTTDAGGSLWILSTARGGHNRFAQTFQAAKRGESKFVPIFHPWWASPFLDEESYKQKAKEFADQPWLLHADYPASPEEAFRESGNPRFPTLPDEEECFDGWVRAHMDVTNDTSVPKENEDGAVRIREDVIGQGPDVTRDYVLYVDPAQGVGGDYTAAHVVCLDEQNEPDIVAWYHTNTTEPVKAARQLDLLGRWFTGRYGPALLAVEVMGGYGDSMINELHLHSDYPRLYTHRPTDNRKRKLAEKIGFPMSRQKRPLIIDRLATQLAHDTGIGHMHPLLRGELATFVKTEEGRVQADVGCHDDLVMSIAGALWVLLEAAGATVEVTTKESEPPRGNNLDSMFAQIEATRKAKQDQIDRERRRSARREQIQQRRKAPVRIGAGR